MTRIVVWISWFQLTPVCKYIFRREKKSAIFLMLGIPQKCHKDFLRRLHGITKEWYVVLFFFVYFIMTVSQDMLVSARKWFSLKHWLIKSLIALSSVIRQKGESQNGGYKKTKHAKFFKKQTFLTHSFFQKIQCALFSCNTCFAIRPFVLLPTISDIKFKRSLHYQGN